jgi:hypothetical protein
MRFRKLRIAWSVGWGSAAVLQCVRWVRNYWTGDLYLYWFGILLMGAFAAAAWLEWSPRFSFSLRTLLVATTLVALALGGMIYSTGRF